MKESEMKNLRNLIVGVVSAVCIPSLASAQSYTVGEMRMFSRANCISVNESITWSPFNEGQKVAWLETSSMQTYSDGSHSQYYAGRRLTSRSRAGCSFCSVGGSSILGWHYLSLPPGPIYGTSYAVQANEICEQSGSAHGFVCRISHSIDCSISEGWF